MQGRTSGPRVALAALLCACMAGCCYDTQCRVDSRVGSLGGCPMDVTQPQAPPTGGNGGGTTPEPIHAPLPTMGTWCPPATDPVSSADQDAARSRLGNPSEQAGQCRPAAYEAPASSRPPRTVLPLEIPSAIPGSTAPPLRLPPVRPGASLAEQRSAIEALFADLEVIPAVPEPASTPGQGPLTLAQLQALAVARNPLIRQAASDVEAARGNMIQAGAYPNPHVGYQSDDINTGQTAGYQGGAIAQTIVTGGKLRLARASAGVDLRNAELALTRARYDLATHVRSNYLGVLVAPRADQGERCPGPICRPRLSPASQTGLRRPGRRLRAAAAPRAGRAGPDAIDPIEPAVSSCLAQAGRHAQFVRRWPQLPWPGGSTGPCR